MTEGVIQKATLRANCNTHASQQIAKEVSRLFIRSRDVGYIRYHTVIDSLIDIYANEA